MHNRAHNRGHNTAHSPIAGSLVECYHDVTHNKPAHVPRVGERTLPRTVVKSGRGGRQQAAVVMGSVELVCAWDWSMALGAELWRRGRVDLGRERVRGGRRVGCGV